MLPWPTWSAATVGWARPRRSSALNPLIRGWVRYYAGVAAKAAFRRLDHGLLLKLFHWDGGHPGKSAPWVARRSWHTRGRNHWVFGVADGPRLAAHARTPIFRHVLVRRDASPDDGNWRYWVSLLGRHPELPTSKSALLKAQHGRCAWCRRHCTELGDLLESDHRIPRRAGGPNAAANRQLLHAHCHDAKTAADRSLHRRPAGGSMPGTAHRRAV
jgi:RNA-directed DNA polymerase